MSHMFYCCQNFELLDISFFDINKVTNMSYMFFDCWNLNMANISSLNIAHVENKYKIFDNRWDKDNNFEISHTKNRRVSSYLNNNEIDIFINVEKKDIQKKFIFLASIFLS